MKHYKLKSKSKRTAAKSVLILSFILSFFLICLFLRLLNEQDTTVTTKLRNKEHEKVQESIEITQTQDIEENESLSELSSYEEIFGLSTLSTHLLEYYTPTTITPDSICSKAISNIHIFQGSLSLNINKKDPDNVLTNILSTAEMLILYKQILNDCFDSTVKDKIMFDDEIVFTIKDRINLFLNKDILGTILSLIKQLLNTLHSQHNNNKKNILFVYSEEINEINELIKITIPNINTQKNTLLEIYGFINEIKSSDVNSVYKNSRRIKSENVEFITFRIYITILPSLLHIRILTYFYDIYVEKNNLITMQVIMKKIHKNDKVKRYLTKFEPYMADEVKELMSLFNKIRYFIDCRKIVGMENDKVKSYRAMLVDMSNCSYKTMDNLVEVSKES